MKTILSDSDLHLMYLIGLLIREIGFYGIQIWILGRPEVRLCNGSRVLDLCGAVRHNGCL